MLSWLSNICFCWCRYGASAERMTPDEFEAGKQWLNETFHLIRYLSNLIADVPHSRVSPNLLDMYLLSNHVFLER
jgi:hypothetical protein